MTQEVVQKWSEMRGLSPYEAAEEIKILIDLGTIEKSPAPTELQVKQPTDIIHEIG